MISCGLPYRDLVPAPCHHVSDTTIGTVDTSVAGDYDNRVFEQAALAKSIQCLQLVRSEPDVRNHCHRTPYLAAVASQTHGGFILKGSRVKQRSGFMHSFLDIAPQQ